MNPSLVRERILKDHETLRQHLIELEDAVVAMLADERKAPKVRALARKLLHELARHTELEDAILAPALRETDAWGQLRADQLLEHHESQRVLMGELTNLYSARSDPREVARATHGFVKDLRADMEHEERDILRVDLLRDDVVALAGESG